MTSVKSVNHANFLRIYFGQRKTWKYHANYLRKKCNKALGTLKKLFHAKWEADRSAMLYLHETLVLSKMDLGSYLYASAAENSQAKLDSVHNIGLCQLEHLNPLQFLHFMQILDFVTRSMEKWI